MAVVTGLAFITEEGWDNLDLAGREPQSTKLPKHLEVFKDSWISPQLKICILGDTGTATDEQMRVAKALEKENCDQVRILGDLIYDDGLKGVDDPEFQEKFFKPYQPIFAGAHPAKFFMVLGNHDYRKDPDTWIDLAKIHPFLYIPARHYAENHGDEVCITTLDTSPFDSLVWFPKSLGQGSWVRKVSKTFKSCQFTIALGHHPYLNTGHHGKANLYLARFFKRNIIGKYDLYMAGHAHILSDEGESKGTHLVVSGAGGKLHDPLDEVPPGGFGQASLGYVVMKFSRNANNKVQAQLDFVAEGPSGFQVAYTRTIIGQGLRDR